MVTCLLSQQGNMFTRTKVAELVLKFKGPATPQVEVEWHYAGSPNTVQSFENVIAGKTQVYLITLMMTAFHSGEALVLHTLAHLNNFLRPHITNSPCAFPAMTCQKAYRENAL